MAVYVSNLVINTGATFTQTFSLENISSNAELDEIFSNENVCWKVAPVLITRLLTYTAIYAMI